MWPGNPPRTIVSNVKAVMLFRKDVMPDYKSELSGYRTVLNAFRMRVSAGDMSLDEFTSAVWDRTCNLLIGESLDPAECINGVWLEDESKGKGSVAFRLEVWFACRDDKVCEAICSELADALRDATKDRSGNSVINTRFQKHDYFVKKHKVRRPRRSARGARPHGASLTPLFSSLTLSLSPALSTRARSLRRRATTRGRSWAACRLSCPRPSPRARS